MVEGGEATALTASGYQAVSTAIFAFVEAGDHILVADSVYQPTRNFCDRLLGQARRRDDLLRSPRRRRHRGARAPQHAAHLHREPRLADVRGAGHPGDRRGRREAQAVAPARQHLGEPALFPPLRPRRRRRRSRRRRSTSSGTPTPCSAPSHRTRAPQKHIARAKEVLGVCPGSEETYLGMRGLRTLATRLAQHQRAGLEMARWLEGRPEVARVLHPGACRATPSTRSGSAIS